MHSIPVDLPSRCRRLLLHLYSFLRWKTNVTNNKFIDQTSRISFKFDGKTLYGFKPWKIHFTWGFYTSHSTGFYITKNAARIVGAYNLKYKYSSDYDYFYRMIVKHKLKGVATKKNELFGIFRRGGYSSKIKFIDHFFETIKIRIDNKQNKLLVLIIFILKFLKNIKKL